MKIKNWFLRTFIYRVYQKSYMDSYGMITVKTFLSGTDTVHYAHLSEDETNRILSVYEIEKKDMERCRYIKFGC